MTKKFTEEQYQEIIKAWQSENTYIHQIEAVIDCLIDDLNLSVTLIGDEAVAIANPLTREWAHEKFVEKEKKYVWQSKQPTLYGDTIRLLKEDDGVVSYAITEKEDPIDSDELLTIREVANSIYDINKFDKEEVK